MKYGFMLIELIVATLIASMIGSLLLTALYQSSRFQTSVDTMFDMSLRVGIVTNQLERDLMGAFVPTQARIKDAQEEEGADKKDTTSQQASDSAKASSDKQGKGEEKKEKMSKPAEKPLEKIFYSTNKGERLDTLTFITNNPLSVFVGKDVGVVKPKAVRVQYVLKPESETLVQASSDNQGERGKDTFTLFRQEGTELDVAKFGPTRSYELINGIKECAVTYTAKIESSSAKDTADKQELGKNDSQSSSGKKDVAKKESKQPEQKPKVYEYKTSKDWVSERKQEDSKATKEEEQEFPRVPYLIEIKMVLWNKQHSKDEEFTLVFELPVDTSPTKEKEEEDKKEDKKPKKDDTDALEKKSNDKTMQARNDKADLVESLTNTLGNLTKALSKL